MPNAAQHCVQAHAASRGERSPWAWCVFLEQCLRDPHPMASVTPSGRQLGRLVASALPRGAHQIVALGPGTGAITAALLRHGIKPQSLFAATLNPGGVRIGTAEIYRQVEQVPEVLEAVAVGQKHGEDERIVLFVHLREGIALDDALRERIKLQIRANTSPHHVPAIISQMNDIPRTISGKISEIAVRETIHGRPVRNTDALANPDALNEYRVLAEHLHARPV